MLKILLAAKKFQEDYVAAVEACGAQAVVKYCPDDDVNFDGLILCGGSDVHPKYYGEEINGSRTIDEARDETELALVKKFMQTGKPILGICRGLQLLNVALGGTLVQHLSNVDEHRDEQKDCEVVHSVTAKDGGIFHALYGKNFSINSLHHQAIKTLGQGLRATLYSEDGTVIEGVEHTQKPYIAVQWHPERTCLAFEREGTINGLAVFEHFIKLCREYATNNRE